MKNPDIKQGYTLLEILVVTTLCVLLASVGYPMMRDIMAQARFRQFACRFSAHLAMAQRVAHALETSVSLDLSPDENHAYLLSFDIGENRQILSSAPPFPRDIGLQLPGWTLPHPTREGTIEQPLSSTHAPALFFTADGGSSATVVFSDGQRVLCAVLSAQTGRTRVFQWHSDQWRRTY